MPAPWARKLKLGTAASSEKVAALLHDNHDSPFLSLYPVDYDANAAIPMMQCTVRPTAIIEEMGGMAALLDRVVIEMGQAYPDYRLLQRDDRCVVAGVVGASLKATMTVLNDVRMHYPCLSELYLMETARHCFILGLSGPAEPDKRPVDDFLAIIRSIRLI